ncbi:aryl-sulfate sulfotransferase [Haloarcula sp. S1CR25-12]|uniref:Aryl-sulfate sulfotransferase n=1 Tax=Haloarcula saliterrae TaxID=2950534 RepID=A0ABU2FEB8_9EURY|nr:aryl-sulfate sulfotransferase [Haloarcula sp. S1CR25-12]MDS0260594.1 aryl-sulfate sulfotransferase [Haloarcula sp. S1CR25-12]
MTRRSIRLVALVVTCLSAAVVAQGAMTAPRTGTAADVPEAPPRAGITVATESARYGTLMAWHPNGSRLYYADEHTKYFDVDPVAGTAATVEYTATDTIHTEGPTCRDPPCARNLVERTNLTTGETEVIRARYDHTETAAEWHDHTRINDTHIAIADMVADQVLLVDTATGLTEWRWDAQNAYPLESGGGYPGDWTHLNDVETLPDGRIMVSLRNQDQVVFIDPDSGVQSNWTLGRDDDHAVLHEQHNPDYIPAERGGPAVVVADSENSRVVEYQRENGGWNRTWAWADGRLQWPRDADRLPNGNTLVTDTHGGRLLEIAPNGSVVWSVGLDHPYDAERLGTGEGSAGGPSARRADLASRGSPAASPDSSAKSDRDTVVAVVKLLRQVVPSRWLNALYYVAPVWMGVAEAVATVAGAATLLAWAVLELRWRSLPVGLRLPVYRSSTGRDRDGAEPAADGDGVDHET